MGAVFWGPLGFVRRASILRTKRAAGFRMFRWLRDSSPLKSALGSRAFLLAGGVRNKGFKGWGNILGCESTTQQAKPLRNVRIDGSRVLHLWAYLSPKKFVPSAHSAAFFSSVVLVETAPGFATLDLRPKDAMAHRQQKRNNLTSEVCWAPPMPCQPAGLESPFRQGLRRMGLSFPENRWLPCRTAGTGIYPRLESPQ